MNQRCNVAALLLLLTAVAPAFGFVLPGQRAFTERIRFDGQRRVESLSLHRLSGAQRNGDVGSTQSSRNEFDFVLGEGIRAKESTVVSTKRRAVALPHSSKAATATLVSSAAASPSASDFSSMYEESDESSSSMVDEEGMGLDADDTDLDLQQNYGKDFVRNYEAKYGRKGYPNIGKLWEQNDYIGILWAYMIPIGVMTMLSTVFASYGLKAYKGKAEMMLDDYANEMVYHDGDFEEMKMCHSDWKRKLSPFFPPGFGKTGKMIRTYLELYAKRKPVSPQAISSLSYVFSIFKLTEEKAAKVLVDVAERLKEKPASAGKLLFFGKRILRTQQAKDALEPIRVMLASSYRVGGDMFVEQSQKTMGEAAYRSAVSAAGKNQTSLTAGWEVLGLDKETATQIFAEVEDDGFLTGAQKLYGELNASKRDEKGRRVDKDGNLLDPEDENKGDEESAGTVFECSECGYTMFPAKGREFKFIPDDFTCPECGAPKDKFVDRSAESMD